MTIIIFDTLFLLSSLVSLLVIFTAVRKNTLLHQIKSQLILVFSFNSIYSFLLFLQWTNISQGSFEKLEDLVGVFIPISWLFLFYAYIHNLDKIKIKESEERLSLALKGAKCGIWDWDLKTGKVFFDENYYRIAGYEPDDFFPSLESWKDRVHPDDIEQTESRVRNYLAGDSAKYVVEFRFQTKSGGWMWIQGRGVVTEWDQKKEPIRFTGVHIDISDRRQAEENIKASETFLNSVVDNIPNMIFVKDAEELRFLRLNNAGEELLGYTKEELIGKNDYDFFPKAEADFFTKKDRAALRSEQVIEIPEEQVQTKNSGKRILKTKKISIRGQEGKPKYLLGISEDITHYKEMEARLRQGQKMEAIGTLAGGIAHDFNNILSPLLGYSEILKEDLHPDSHHQEYVDEIYKAALRAKDLVQQILSFSRQMEKEKKPVKLQTLLTEALKLLRPSIPKTIDIQTHLDSKDCIVMADSTQLHQIIMNLATNSYQAMRENGGLLKIILNQTLVESKISGLSNLKPGYYACLKIIDTGSGIPKELMEKIFDPYFTTKETGEGTGLGLSVVQGIVGNMGGGIYIYSEVDKGTEVHVYFPVIEKKVAPVIQALSGPVLSGSENILIVDDEKAVVRMEKEILESLGYHVTAFTESIEAFDVFQGNPELFDLVVSDMTMPHMTGDQLAQKIRSVNSETPIILSTGFSERMNMDQAQLSGVKAILKKPFMRSEFAQIIRKVLDENKTK